MVRINVTVVRLEFHVHLYGHDVEGVRAELLEIQGSDLIFPKSFGELEALLGVRPDLYCSQLDHNYVSEAIEAGRKVCEDKCLSILE